MTSISSIFKQNNPYESSIQQLLQIEGLKKLQLQSQQNELQVQKKALSDIDSKLSSLNSLLTTFKESPAENFRPLSGTSSDPDAISIVSTSGMRNPGSYSISVSQLAKEDIVLSGTFATTGTDFNTSGSGTFDIAIGGESPVSFAIDTAGLNNQEALDAIAEKVNEQLGDKVTASVFQLGDGTARLSFKSVGTGKDNRISISNTQGDFSALNMANIYTEDELNAKFTLDSVAFERSSNLVNDVIDGFTFELKKETSGTEKLSVTRDTEGARASIDSFIEKFNEVNDTIRSKTFLNGETGARGPLQKERTIRNLSFNLRQSLALPVASLSGTSLSSLNDIGIELKQDGTMHVKDSAALEEALISRPEEVEQLFTADDGIAATIEQKIGLYVSDEEGSIFDSIKQGIDRKIDRIDDRIQTENRFLVQREEQLRAEFARLQQVIDQGQTQFNQVVSFQNRLGFGF